MSILQWENLQQQLPPEDRMSYGEYLSSLSPDYAADAAASATAGENALAEADRLAQLAKETEEKARIQAELQTSEAARLAAEEALRLAKEAADKAAAEAARIAAEEKARLEALLAKAKADADAAAAAAAKAALDALNRANAAQVILILLAMFICQELQQQVVWVLQIFLLNNMQNNRQPVKKNRLCNASPLWMFLQIDLHAIT